MIACMQECVEVSELRLQELPESGIPETFWQVYHEHGEEAKGIIEVETTGYAPRDERDEKMGEHNVLLGKGDYADGMNGMKFSDKMRCLLKYRSRHLSGRK